MFPLATLRKPMPLTTNLPFARLWRALVAELVGVMFFVFFVAVSVQAPALVNPAEPVSGLLLTAVMQGLAILAVIAATATTSGGHINPAVTLALVVIRSQKPLHGLLYMIAQLAGAIAGSAIALACLGPHYAGALGATTPSVLTPFGTCAFEFMLTCLLIFTVLGTAVHGAANEAGVKPLAPIPIGYAVLVGVLAGGKITGGSMNPARSFGPAVVSGTWTGQWIYWAGPLVAAIVVGLLYKAILLSAPITKAQAEHAGFLADPDQTMQSLPRPVLDKRLTEADLIGRQAPDATALSEIAVVPREAAVTAAQQPQGVASRVASQRDLSGTATSLSRMDGTVASKNRLASIADIAEAPAPSSTAPVSVSRQPLMAAARGVPSATPVSVTGEPTRTRRASIPPVRIIPPPRRPVVLQAVEQGVDHSHINFTRVKHEFEAELRGIDTRPHSVRESTEEIYQHMGVYE